MQHNCTTVKTEEPEDDGRSLLAANQYRLELQELEPLDILQQRTLAQMAREGNQEARTLLFEHCLKGAYYTAWQYARIPGNPEVLDICQAGSEAMLHHIDEALKSRNPCGFLLVAARWAMAKYCTLEDRLIQVPPASYYQCGKRAPLTVSLMASRYGEGERTLLEELGEEGLDEQVRDESEKSYPELEEAVRQLSLSDQRLLVQLYGLGESPQLKMRDLVAEGQESEKKLYQRRERALSRLRRLLSPKEPRGSKTKRVQELVERNPEMTAAELGRQAGCDQAHAAMVRKAYLASRSLEVNV